MVSVLDAAGKEVILVETVGVGQDEIEIVRLADVSLVILVPGMGDELQALKGGNHGDWLMSLSSIKQIVPTLRNFSRSWSPCFLCMFGRTIGGRLFLKTIATEGQGVPELIEAVASFDQFRRSHPEFVESRKYGTEESLLALLKDRLLEKVIQQDGMRDRIQTGNSSRGSP